MTGLVVHRSARVERLLDPLLEWMGRADPDPFVPMRIVVASHGMRRWLSHRLAQRLDPDGGGVLANVEFPFPGSLVREIVNGCGVTQAGEEADDEDPWDPQRLAWLVARVLLASGGEAPLRTVAGDLGDERSSGIVGRRTWRLARDVADVFNDYVVHRADMVTAWARGEDLGPDGSILGEGDRWQPWLWRALLEHVEDPARRIGDALEVLRSDRGLPDTVSLPGDVAIFGLSTLPPRHLDLLAGLARHTGVEWYVPTPSPARWDALSDAVHTGSPVPDARHPLLASCGRVTDDAAWLVAGHAPVHHTLDDGPGDVHAGDESETLLGRIQRDVRSDALLPVDGRRLVIDADDTSLQIHRCHGPARQAEVLRDAVLGLLASDATLEPRDVIVMTPDVESFAPLVRAAFGTDGHRPHLPVSVADRQVGRSDPVADALRAVVTLARGRVTASAVLDVLGREVIARRAGLDHEDLTRISEWVGDTGIRWAVDEHDRARSGQPADRHHTWRAGLDRLLLGVTMADEDDRVVGDVTPYDHVEGGDVDLLGRFVAVCTALFDALATLRAARSPAAWVEVVTRVADQLFEVADEDRWRIHDLVDLLDGLDDVDDVDVDLAGIDALLGERLDRRRGAAGYETGAVTLCELVPMRSIPHRVVCLLGLDDARFPRPSTRRGIDLIGRHRRTGDRDRRDEDRHLFLEALLSAGDHLVVTTTGRDARTNEPRPPAVVVAELRDTIDRVAESQDGTAGADAVTFDHPLHAFSPVAFGAPVPGARPVPPTFDVALLDAARALGSGESRPWPFLDGLPPGDGDDAPGERRDDDRGGDRDDARDDARDDLVTIDDLVRSLVHPTRTFLERRLGLRLGRWEVRVDDSEPMDLHPFDRPGYVRGVLERIRDDDELERWVRARLASGTVPAGTPGATVLANLVDDVRELSERLDADLTRLGADVDQLAEVLLEVDVDGQRLVGRTLLAPVAGASVQVHVDPRRDRPARHLEVWVHHVVASAQHGRVATLGVCGSGDSPRFHRFAPFGADDDAARDGALEVLGDLVAMRDEAHRRPLPLFERASHAFAESGDLFRAGAAFSPDFGEGDLDAFVEQAHGVEVSLDDVLADPDRRTEFEQLARALWRPLTHHRVSRIEALVRTVTP